MVAAGPSAPPEGTSDLPPKWEALSAMSASQLKAVLREHGVPTDDCFEKSDLQARARTLGQ